MHKPAKYNIHSLLDQQVDTPKFIVKNTITLMPKPDKDATNTEKYRPISLMDIHTKILSKISAH